MMMKQIPILLLHLLHRPAGAHHRFVLGGGGIGHADRRKTGRHLHAPRPGGRHGPRPRRVPHRRVSDMRSGRCRRHDAGRCRDSRAAIFRADRDPGRDLPHEELSRRIPTDRSGGRRRVVRRRGRPPFEHHRPQYD